MLGETEDLELLLDGLLDDLFERALRVTAEGARICSETRIIRCVNLGRKERPGRTRVMGVRHGRREGRRFEPVLGVKIEPEELKTDVPR